MPRGILGHAKHNTICEVHRKLYATIDSLSIPEKEELQELVLEAFGMAKKMSNKLMQYNRNLGSDWYQVHKNDGGKITDEN